MRLTGGPGYASLDYLQRTADERGAASVPLLADHDLIYLDQRGTGLSSPNLDCPENDEAVWSILGTHDSYESERDVIVRALERCADRLEAEGVDLAAYNTTSIAADVADVRTALGVEHWILWGTSYGTLLAQQVMRADADGVKAAVLDSVVPPDATDPTDRIRSSDRALDELFSACEADEACNMAHPRLRSRFQTMLDNYDREPLAATVSDPQGRPRDLLIGAGELVSGLFVMLYDEDKLASIPSIIELMEQRNPALQAGFEQGFWALFDGAEAMAISVGCTDRYYNATPEELSAAVRENPEYSFLMSLSFNNLCAGWDLGPHDGSFNELVDSGAPTLVLAGTFDPITPPDDGRRVAEHLDNATFVQSDANGHGVFRFNDCADHIVVALAANPSAPVDTSCVAEIRPPEFGTTARTGDN